MVDTREFVLFACSARIPPSCWTSGQGQGLHLYSAEQHVWRSLWCVAKHRPLKLHLGEGSV
eukprot:1211951-Alexandrium_andersonii.AAC.1